MGETNIALKGKLIGIAVVALPVTGFVVGRKLNDDPASGPRPVPLTSAVSPVSQPCPACPVCPPAATTAVLVAPPVIAPPSATLSASPGDGTLIVECLPACSGIVVDGKELGLAPLTGLGLPAGKHKILAKFDSGGPRIADVNVAAGQTIRLSMSPAAAPRDPTGVGPGVGAGEGCNPPYWESEDGSRIPKPACQGH